MLTLYDAPRCPYCARVRIVLAEKDVPYETVVVDLSDRPAWLLEHNPPDGRVPVLEEDGWVLPESAVVDEYLEERFPEPPLLPADPGERAAARLVVFRFDALGKPYYALRREESGAAPPRYPIDPRPPVLPGPELGVGARPAILLCAFWPPTNEAVRRFSPNPAQNPSGWIGSNWENRGYDVLAYFPEFSPPTCTNCGAGTGDFTVDYQDTSADFWAIAGALALSLLVSFVFAGWLMQKLIDRQRKQKENA